MSNQELRFLIKNQLECLKSKNPKSIWNYKIIYDKYQSLIYSNFISKIKSYPEKMYCFINNISKFSVCEHCGNNVSFVEFPKGYKKYCSLKCLQKSNVGKLQITISEMKKRFYLIHKNKYTYDWTTYKSTTTKMKIICSIHGEFWQQPNVHTEGCGCKSCSTIIKINKLRLSFDEIQKDITKIHKNKFIIFEKTFISNSHSLKVMCNDCKHIFFPIANDIKNGSGCPNCNTSKGEIEIKKYLVNNNIKFEQEKRFKDCRNKKPLPFDFYIKDKNICIEYDGEQHYKPTNFGGTNNDKIFFDFKQQQIRDEIKTEYCKNNNIQLIRIPYWEFDNIEEILKEIYRINIR